MSDCVYEELEHTAEIGVRVRAPSPAELYACAAQAMFSLLQTEPDAQSDAVCREVVIDSADPESLMVDWLGELLYFHETTGAILAGCHVDLWSPTHLEATVRGFQPMEPPSLHIKAVTYHQLTVAQTCAGWTAEVFFDI